MEIAADAGWDGCTLPARPKRNASTVSDVLFVSFFLFFFQAEDGIRDVERSRGLGDVYKRQVPIFLLHV